MEQCSYVQQRLSALPALLHVHPSPLIQGWTNPHSTKTLDSEYRAFQSISDTCSNTSLEVCSFRRQVTVLRCIRGHCVGQGDDDTSTGHREGGEWRCVECDTSPSDSVHSLKIHSPRRGNECTLARDQRSQIEAISATTTDQTLFLKTETKQNTYITASCSVTQITNTHTE